MSKEGHRSTESYRQLAITDRQITEQQLTRMTLNLNKHGAVMQAAWKRVMDAHSNTNWALFGYEGTSFDLKLVGEGEDGIEEMKEDLSASRIMYAFLKVEDPKTSLPKFVFLHWQGESVPGTRKGLSATHLRDVQKYFHGAHLTLNVRNEDELEEDDIAEKVSKITASAFNFKEKHHHDVQPAKVGTAHEKINPKKELPDMDAREKFWNAEENRERERLAKERERKRSEAKQLEDERKSREEQESRARDVAIKERERKISQIRDSETGAPSAKTESKQLWEAQQAEDAKEAQARQNRGEEMKRKRSEEARQLIGQRSVEARAVFERNSSVGQMNFRRQSSTGSQNASNSTTTTTAVEEQIPKDVPNTNTNTELPPSQTSPQTSPKRTEATENVVNANEVSTDDIVVPPPESFGNDDNRQQLRNQNNAAAPDVTNASASTLQPDLIQDVTSKNGPDLTAVGAASVDTDGKKNVAEYGVCAMALYDYQAADDTEISFDPGQLVTHIDQIDPGWWQGLGPDGNYGLFPANYVEIVDASQVAEHQ